MLPFAKLLVKILFFLSVLPAIWSSHAMAASQADCQENGGPFQCEKSEILFQSQTTAGYPKYKTGDEACAAVGQTMGGGFDRYRSAKYWANFPNFGTGCEYDLYDYYGVFQGRYFYQNWVLPNQNCRRPPDPTTQWSDLSDTQEDINGRMWCGYEAPQEEQTCKVGQPVLPGTGVEAYSETDYTSTDPQSLIITRHYRSSRGGGSASGVSPYDGAQGGWMLSLETGVFDQGTVGRKPSVKVARQDGSLVSFYAVQATTGIRTWSTYSGTRDVLIEQQSTTGVRLGWQYRVAADDSVETYDAAGKIQSVKQRNGWITSFTYSTASTPVATYLSGSSISQPGRLLSVRNQFGRDIRFVYDGNGRLVQVLPPGAVKDAAVGSAASPIRYHYEEAAQIGTTIRQNQLTSVTWQDGRTKRYHYEDSRFPQALTGITDEAGVRIVTHTYDSLRRVVEEHKAGGADSLQFSYSSDIANALYYTTVTDASGSNGSATTRTYTLKNTAGVLRSLSVTAPCPLCSNTQANTLYDGYGNVLKTIGHDGLTTFYAYDAKGREIERAVFSSAYQASTTRPALNLANTVTSTQWHGTWSLPVQIAEPRKLTSFTYDATGNQTGQSWTATTDPTGAVKFAAIKTGNLYATGQAFNLQGLVSTVVENTNGVEKLRFTFVYDTSGNITSIRNVTDNVTATMSSYNANGRLLAGKTDLGVTVAFEYSPRGFVTGKLVNGQRITYVQNAIGLTTDVKTPGQQSVHFNYDANHRLTGVLLNGAAITPTMLAQADYPDSALKGSWLALKSDLKQGVEQLISSAHAQVAAPLFQQPIIANPSTAMPGQPEYDARTDMMTMRNFSQKDEAARKAAQALARLCECKPDGGYNKPTFTSVTYTHLLLGGHLSPMFADKSYFTEKVGQAMVDEIVAKNKRVPDGRDSSLRWIWAASSATLKQPLDLVQRDG